MQDFLHQLASGIVSGSFYGGFALALVMVHRATGHLNFAQGEMATLTAFLAFTALQLGLPFWLAALIASVVAFFLGAITEALIMRPFATKAQIRLVIVTIGLFMLLNGSSGFIFGFSTQTVPSPFPDSWASDYLSAHDTGSLIVVGAMVVVLFVVFRFTEFGLAMKAAALNPTSSRLVGINVELMRAIGWGIAGIIGNIVGLLVAPAIFLEPNMLLGVLVYGFAAALVGGIDNPWGAAVGGIIVGVAENLVGAYVVGTELKLSVALSLIILVLLLRPQGIFGHRSVKRV
jgi:branched-chain amino acid transport system permease protein